MGIIIFLFPPIYGEGYDSIKAILNSHHENLFNNLGMQFPASISIMILFLTGIILLKPVATTLTISSGGNGGIFAPSVFLGGI